MLNRDVHIKYVLNKKIKTKENDMPPPKDKPTTTTQTTTKKPRPIRPKHYKKFEVSIYANDGSYNSELIDQFIYKAPHIPAFGGGWVQDADEALEKFMKKIGEDGWTVKSRNGSKLYYPPRRIHYIEAAPMSYDNDDFEFDD